MSYLQQRDEIREIARRRSMLSPQSRSQMQIPRVPECVY